MRPQPEHLPDDIAAAHKAADDLLDALHYIRRQYRPKDVPQPITAAIEQTFAVWMIIRTDLQQLAQS